MMKMRYGLLFVVGLFLAALVVFPTLAQDETLPDSITVEDPGRFPEGIEWDSLHGQFLLSSLRDGTVIAVADDGTLSPFADAPEEGLSAVGIHIDENTNRLLVAYGQASVFSDPAATGRAALGIFDLETGEQLHFVDLGTMYDGRHFGNDVTADSEGNAFVTDSFSPVIYKVTPDGEATVFVENEKLGDPNFGLNGIDFVDDTYGYLLVSVNGNATLWSIPSDDPSIVQQVELDQAFSADGMVVTPDGDVIAAAQIVNEDGSMTPAVISVSSDDNWSSATIEQRVETEGVTTVTLRDGEVYAIYPKLGQMGSQPPPENFDIQHVELSENETEG